MWAHAGLPLCPYLRSYLVLVTYFFMGCIRENRKGGISVELVSGGSGLLRTEEIPQIWQEARRAAHFVLLERLEKPGSP